MRLGDLARRVNQNAKYYQDLAADIVSGRNVSSKALIQVITIVLLCGFIYCLIKQRTAIEYYVFFYILTYIVWTSVQGHRFLVPIIPFIFYYLIRALWLIPDSFSFFAKKMGASEANWDKYRTSSNQIILAILVVLVIYLNFISDVNIIRNERKKPYYTGSTANFLDTTNWIKNNTPPDAVIAADRGPSVYMLSDRRTFTFPWVSDINEVMVSMRKNGIDYVIYTPWGYALKYLSPALKERADSFLKVYESGDCIVYELTEVKNHIPD